VPNSALQYGHLTAFSSILFAHCGQSRARLVFAITSALPSLVQKLRLSSYSAEQLGQRFMRDIVQ
jgi:hypothetical protein